MRLRHKKGAEENVKSENLCINKLDNHQINFSDYFNNNNKELFVEFGMGKGKFICEMAKNNPNINFIGVEKSATIVLKAIESTKIIFKNFDNNFPPNLRFICDNIENITSYFKNSSINKIFLNFSDPWPKKRHESRRLTHIKFLKLYESLLTKNGIIEFKTDNKDLFDYSLEEIKKSSFKLLDFTYDLHNDANLSKNNIMTEYEEKFSKKGNKICKLILQCT